ncbi:MAG: hypothetical protein WAO12_00445 [Venatoribacter sp.]
MNALSLRLSADLVGKTDTLAKALKLTRTDYIKLALERFNEETEQELFAKALKKSVYEVREQTQKDINELDGSSGDGLNGY